MISRILGNTNGLLTIPRRPELKGLSLHANFSWTFLGQLVYVSCQWGMLVVLAKVGDPEMLGLFSLGLAVTTPIIMFSMLQLRAIQSTDARQEYQFGHYLALRLSMCALAMLIIAAVVFAAGYSRSSALIILMVGGFKVVEGISDVYQGLMQRLHRMDRIAVALMVKGPLFLIGLTAMLYFTGSLFSGVAVLIFISLAVLVFYERENASYFLARLENVPVAPQWHWRRLLGLARLSLPLGIVMMLLALNVNIPRYFIERFMSVRELGYFSALVYPQAAGVLIVGALGQAASPQLAKYFADGNRREFSRLVGKMVLIGVALSLAALTGAALFGREILTLLYQADYAQYDRVFVWLMAAAGLSFIASFLGYAMTAARRFLVQVPLFIGSAVVATVACFYLIPMAGLLGAAQALVIVAIAQIMGSAGVVFWSLHGESGAH